MQQRNLEYPLSILFFFPLIWAFSGLILYKDGHKVMVIFAIISMVVSLYLYGTKLVIHHIKNSRLVQAILLSLSFYVFIDVYRGYGSSIIRAFAVMFVILAFTPPFVWQRVYRHLASWVLFGSLSSFFFTAYQAYVLGLGRAWVINPIIYTTVTCIFALISVKLLIVEKRIKIKAIALVSFTLSFNSLILGEARGVILAFCIALFTLLLLLKVSKCLPIGRYVTILGVIMVALLFVNKQTIENRIAQTNNEVVTIKKGNLNSSIGLRFQMWESGLRMFSNAPLVGHGQEHFLQKIQQYEQGLITKPVTHFRFYHNQFVEALAKTGIIGLSLVSFLLLLPWWIHYKRNTFTTLTAFTIALMYVVASLTDTPMSHPQTIIMYFVFIALLLERPTTVNNANLSVKHS